MDIASMFGLIINLMLFIFFFSTGYETSLEKHFSAGFMLMLSGFMFLAMMVQTLFLDLLHPIYTIPLMSIFGVYIILIGIRKMVSECED